MIGCGAAREYIFMEKDFLGWSLGKSAPDNISVQWVDRREEEVHDTDEEVVGEMEEEWELELVNHWEPADSDSKLSDLRQARSKPQEINRFWPTNRQSHSPYCSWLTLPCWRRFMVGKDDLSVYQAYLVTTLTPVWEIWNLCYNQSGVQSTQIFMASSWAPSCLLQETWSLSPAFHLKTPGYLNLCREKVQAWLLSLGEAKVLVASVSILASESSEPFYYF